MLPQEQLAQLLAEQTLQLLQTFENTECVSQTLISHRQQLKELMTRLLKPLQQSGSS